MSKEKQKHTNVQTYASELQLQLNDTVNQGISHPADVENCQIFTTTQPKRLATTHEHATRFRQAIKAEDPQQLTVGTVPISETQPRSSFGFQGEEHPLHDLIITPVSIIFCITQNRAQMTGSMPNARSTQPLKLLYLRTHRLRLSK
jgi:hypothetical protein